MVDSEFLELFSPIDATDPPPAKRVTKLDLEIAPGKVPKRIPKRRIPNDGRRQALAHMIDERVGRGIWLRQTGLDGKLRPWGAVCTAPVNLVLKPPGPDGTPKYRPTFDYREANDCTLDVAYNSPNPAEALEAQNGFSIWSLLDLTSGFDNIEMTERAMSIAAVSTDQEIFYPTRMPQGLKQAPAHMQAVVQNEVLAGLEDICTVYIDDVLIRSKTPEEHEQHLRMVLERFRLFGFKVNRAKMRLGMRRLTYLGHVISPDGVTIAPSRRQGIVDMKKPENAAELASFLGVAGYFREHIPRYGERARSLTKLVNLRQRFAEAWGDEQERDFQYLQQQISRCPLLHWVDRDKPLYVASDASNAGAGGYCFQIAKDGQHLPIAFYSHGFSDVESRWATHHQEAFAFVMAMKKFTHYIAGHPDVRCLVDHSSLRFIHDSKTPKIQRWRDDILSQFQFSVDYIPGVENVIPDALSRLLDSTPENGVEISVADRAEVTDDISQDAVRRILFITSDPSIEHNLHPVARLLMMYNALAGDSDENLNQPVHPFGILTADRTAAIRAVHNGIRGHAGVERTLELIQNPWLGIRRDVANYVRRCAICQKIRAPRGRAPAKLRSIRVAEPFETWALDTLTLTPDELGMAHVVVAIDMFSRAVELFPVRSMTKEEFFPILIQLFARYNNPTVGIMTDGHGQFVNQMIDEYAKLNDIKHHITIPYTHHSNGRVERANRDIVERIRALCLEKEVAGRWSEYLPLIASAHNNAASYSTGVAPNDVLFAGQLNSKRVGFKDLDSKANRSLSVDSQAYLDRYEAAADAIQKSVRKFMLEQHPEESYNEYEFALGSWILFKLPNDAPRADKTVAPWIGPWEVIKKESDLRYRIRNPNDVGMEKTVHLDWMKPFYTPVGVEADELDALRKTLAAKDAREYVIDRILSHDESELYREPGQPDKYKYRFLVKWQGFPDEYNSLEPFDLLKDTKALVDYLSDKDALRTLMRALGRRPKQQVATIPAAGSANLPAPAPKLAPKPVAAVQPAGPPPKRGRGRPKNQPKR